MASVLNYLHHHPRIADICWALGVAFLACFFSSTSTSPLYPATNIDFINTDSNFFLYEASLWLKGYRPYLDFYDHKGLYHLALNGLGLLLGGRYGLFFLQVLFGTTALYFLFQSLREIGAGALTEHLLSSFLYCALYCMGASGNTEGEWVLPLVSLSFYFYSKGIVHSNNHDLVFGSLCAGIEIALSLNSRPLDALWGGAAALSYFVYYLREKRDRSLLFAVLAGLLGILVPSAVFLLVAYCGGYLPAMMQSIFLDSERYLAYPLVSMRAFNWVLIALVYLLGVFLFLWQWRHNDKSLALFYFISATLAAILYALVARYTTYYWSGYTFYILNLVYAVSSVPPLGKKKVRLNLVLTGLWCFVWVGWNSILIPLYYTTGFEDFSYQKSLQVKRVLSDGSLIPQTDLQTPGKVFGIDVDAGIYLLSGVTTTEKYCVNQTWWSRFKPEVKTEIVDYLSSAERPQWVLLKEYADTKATFQKDVETYYTLVPGSLEASGNMFTLYRAK